MKLLCTIYLTIRVCNDKKKTILSDIQTLDKYYFYKVI